MGFRGVDHANKPTIQSRRFDPNALDRVQRYLSRATALVAAPFCVFLEPVHEAGGRLVVVSSSAVENTVREWPHYIAAKSAIEAYARVAPLQYPRLAAVIVRPPKLLTDMTNTPSGRSGAIRPEEFAVQLGRRLQAPVRDQARVTFIHRQSQFSQEIQQVSHGRACQQRLRNY